MALLSKSVTLAVGATNTTPANNILAGNSAVERYIRSIHVVNTTAAAVTLTAGSGVAAVLSATNSDLASALSVAANASVPIQYYGGKGKRLPGAGTANAIFAIGSVAAALLMTVVYDEDNSAA